MIVNPAPKSLEVLCRYNMIDLNDAGIRGGRLTDISLGMNYFINKYVAKINYTHMMVGNSSPKGGDDFNLIQAGCNFHFSLQKIKISYLRPVGKVHKFPGSDGLILS